MSVDHPILFAAALIVGIGAALLTFKDSISEALTDFEDDRWWMIFGIGTWTHVRLYIALLVMAAYTALSYKGLVWLLVR